jgi:hypothetical protein
VPTPVGPVAPDPDDPDLWTEWDTDDDDEGDGGFGPSRFGWPVRLVAAIAILSIVLLLVL